MPPQSTPQKISAPPASASSCRPSSKNSARPSRRASKLGAHYALILGDNEVAEGTWTLKTLADGTQQKFTEPHLLDFLKKL